MNLRIYPLDSGQLTASKTTKQGSPEKEVIEKGLRIDNNREVR